ncbi:hypothetical protein HUU59_11010 [bacterium]|nr:hypothetical protein [bacterium]
MTETEGLNESWQARINRALETLDWSRPRLAMTLHCSERTIWNWQNGNCEPHWNGESRGLLDELETRHRIRERYTERLKTTGHSGQPAAAGA